MATIEFKTEALDRFAADLSQTSSRIWPEAVKVMNRTMLEAKKAQQADFQGSSNEGFRKIAAKVSYTPPAREGDAIVSRLGVDKVKAGNLANIAVFGTSKGGGTHLHPTYHLRNELPAAQSYLLLAASKALRG